MDRVTIPDRNTYAPTVGVDLERIKVVSKPLLGILVHREPNVQGEAVPAAQDHGSGATEKNGDFFWISPMVRSLMPLPAQMTRPSKQVSPSDTGSNSSDRSATAGTGSGDDPLNGISTRLLSELPTMTIVSRKVRNRSGTKTASTIRVIGGAYGALLDFRGERFCPGISGIQPTHSIDWFPATIHRPPGGDPLPCIFEDQRVDAGHQHRVRGFAQDRKLGVSSIGFNRDRVREFAEFPRPEQDRNDNRASPCMTGGTDPPSTLNPIPAVRTEERLSDEVYL